MSGRHEQGSALLGGYGDLNFGRPVRRHSVPGFPQHCLLAAYNRCLLVANTGDCWDCSPHEVQSGGWRPEVVVRNSLPEVQKAERNAGDGA
jgi:hypothetical protein